MPGGRAAPGVPSASFHSPYGLAPLVAGHPRRDPQLEGLKLPIPLQLLLGRGPALQRLGSRRHGDLFRSGLHSSSDNPLQVGTTLTAKLITLARRGAFLLRLGEDISGSRGPDLD